MSPSDTQVLSILWLGLAQAVVEAGAQACP